ncbi:hypothetical protein C8Q76DRAFT_862947 [Earliella scabrosa]|nr:hypothetical protein C8Q76DRAFT_862947 [Earliella scabrosa]
MPLSTCRTQVLEAYCTSPANSQRQGNANRTTSTRTAYPEDQSSPLVPQHARSICTSPENTEHSDANVNHEEHVVSRPVEKIPTYYADFMRGRMRLEDGWLRPMGLTELPPANGASTLPYPTQTPSIFVAAINDDLGLSPSPVIVREALNFYPTIATTLPTTDTDAVLSTIAPSVLEQENDILINLASCCAFINLLRNCERQALTSEIFHLTSTFSPFSSSPDVTSVLSRRLPPPLRSVSSKTLAPLEAWFVTHPAPSSSAPAHPTRALDTRSLVLPHIWPIIPNQTVSIPGSTGDLPTRTTDPTPCAHICTGKADCVNYDSSAYATRDNTHKKSLDQLAHLCVECRDFVENFVKNNTPGLSHH